MAVAAASDGALALTAPSATRTPRWPRRFAAVSWAGWAAAFLSLWAQYQFGVYDTLAWLWLPFATVGALAGLAALLVGLARAAVGPRRRAMFGWAIVGFTPVLVHPGSASFFARGCLAPLSPRPEAIAQMLQLLGGGEGSRMRP